jgi:Na+-translocating ferredoxin:NAD+ oxidoreductase subunit E
MTNDTNGYRKTIVLSLFAGLCPALAVTAQTVNAIVLGLAVVFVMTMANLVFFIAEDIIPEGAERVVKLVFVATLVAIVEILMESLAPRIWKNMGIYLPLTAVNCLILEETGIGSGLLPPARVTIERTMVIGAAYVLTLTGIAVVREVLGAGRITLFGFGDFDGVLMVPGLADHPARFFGLPAGALIVAGYARAAFARVFERRGGRS